MLCEGYLGALRPKLSAQAPTRNGGRIALVLLVCLLSAGCVVSKGQYETQLIRTQGFEARVADLEDRLILDVRKNYLPHILTRDAAKWVKEFQQKVCTMGLFLPNLVHSCYANLSLYSTELSL